MKRTDGFTLLELLMVMFILSLVTIAALPVNKWLRSQGVKLATEQLRGDLQLARLMAIKHRKSCSIEVNTPSINRYSNSLNHQMVDLATYRGGVHFMIKGPGGGVASKTITFNRRGMAMSIGSIFLSDRDGSNIFRVRAMPPGGISVFRWSGNGWK